jgi:hypothetical protein
MTPLTPADLLSLSLTDIRASGDIEALRDAALMLREGYATLHARVEVAERGASALRLELEEARKQLDETLAIARPQSVEVNELAMDKRVLTKELEEARREVARVTERAAALLNDGLTKHAALRAVETERDALRAINEALTQQVAELNVEVGNITLANADALTFAAERAKALADERDAAEARCAQLREAVDKARRHIAVSCPLHYEDHQNRDGSGKSGCYIDFPGVRAVLLACDTALSATDSRWLDAKLEERQRAGSDLAAGIVRDLTLDGLDNPRIRATIAPFVARVYARAIGEAAQAVEDTDPVEHGRGYMRTDDSAGTIRACAAAVRALLNGKAGRE